MFMMSYLDQNESEEEFDDDDRFVLTPMSIFYLALEEAEFIEKDSVINDTIQMKLAWRAFCDGMRKAGYLKGEP